MVSYASSLVAYQQKHSKCSISSALHLTVKRVSLHVVVGGQLHVKSFAEVIHSTEYMLHSFPILTVSC